jgi:hypothetical protein
MKAYLKNLKDKPEWEQAKLRAQNGDDVDVFFSLTPQRIYWSREEAEGDLRLVVRIHKGSHYCEFDIEPQPQGGFALVCKSHPDL